MSNNNLDQELNKHIALESMEFDQDAMWSSLEAQLDKKRRPFWLFFLFFGVASALGVSWFAFSGVDSATESSSLTAIHSTNNNTTQAHDNNIKNSSAGLIIKTQKERNTADENIINQNIKNTNNSQVISSNKINKSHAVQLNTSNTTIKKETKNTSTSQAIQSATTQKTNQLIVPVSNRLSTANSNQSLTNEIKENPNRSSNTLQIVEKSNLNENAKSIDISSKQVTDNTREVSTTIFGPIVSASMGSMSAPEKIGGAKLMPLMMKSNGLTYVPLRSKKDWSRCEIDNPWNFLVEAYGGAGLPLMTHTTVEGTSFSFLTDWEAAQSPVSTFTGGLQLVVQSPSGFEAAAGIEYQRLSQKLESDQTVITMIQIFDPMAYFFIDANGDRIWVADTITRTVITNSKQTTEIRHQLLNIPIRVGYMTQFGDWNVGAHVGAVLHLSHKVDGLVLQPDGSYVELNENNQELVYKKDMGFSYSADLHVGRQVSDKVELFVRPTFRYNPTSWATNSYALNTKIQMANFNAGIRYTIK